MPGSELARRRILALLIAVAAAGAVLALALGGGGDGEGDDQAAAPPLPDASPRVLAALLTLGEEEKVGQLILSGFEGKTAEEAAGSLSGRLRPGGLLVGPQNWPGAAAGEELLAAVAEEEAAGEIPPLLATVQEGGTYRSLVDLPPAERAIEIGDRGDPELAARWGEETAEALADVGITLNLAPVADIATLDSPIADRAFSDDPETTVTMTAAAVRGCVGAGIACAVSHFPGEGGVNESTAQGPGAVSLDRATLAARELPPFEAGFDAGAQAVIVSHALYVAYDPVTPAGLSPPIYDELLRGRLDFDGVAITDDLQAGAIRAGLRVEDAAVQALTAGADMVQISDPAAARRASAALLEALGSGALDPERVDEAVARVLTLKAGLGLLD
jgi:beta-N-acetylhexosaminidase